MFDAIRKEIAEEYAQPHGKPWIVGFSGGKDSTLVAHLVVEHLLSIPRSERTRTVHIVANDTLVESPLVIGHFSDEAMAGVPRLRLPAGLEVIESDCDSALSFSAFDKFFEGGKAFERHRDSEFDPQRMQSLGDGLAEECAVDSGLDLCAGPVAS